MRYFKGASPPVNPFSVFHQHPSKCALIITGFTDFSSIGFSHAGHRREVFLMSHGE